MPPNPTPVFLASSLCPMPMLLVPSFPPWLHRGGPAQGLPGVPRGLITSEDEAGRAAVDHHHLRQECPYTGEEREPGSFRGQAGRPQGSVWESQRAALSHCAHTPPHCLQQPTAAPFPQQATRWCSPTPQYPQRPWAVSHLAPPEDLWAAEAADCPCGSPQNSTAVLLPGWWTPSLGTCRCHRCGPLLLGSCSPPGPALTLWPCLCVARLLSWPASCKYTSCTPHPQHPLHHTPTHTHAPPHHL